MLIERFLLSFLLFLSISKGFSNTIPHHVVNLPKFLSPSTLAKICHTGAGSSIDDGVEKTVGAEWNRPVFTNNRNIGENHGFVATTETRSGGGRG